MAEKPKTYADGDSVFAKTGHFAGQTGVVESDPNAPPTLSHLVRVRWAERMYSYVSPTTLERAKATERLEPQPAMEF